MEIAAGRARHRPRTDERAHSDGGAHPRTHRPDRLRRQLYRAIEGAAGADEPRETGRAHRRTDQAPVRGRTARGRRSEEHTSELQSLMRISYAVFCLKKKKPHP